MNKEISLDELFKYFLKNIKWIVCVTLIFLVAAFFFSTFCITKMYTAKTTLIASFTTLDKEVDEIPNQVTTTQTNAAIALSDAYSEILNSSYHTQLIMEQLTNWENISEGMIKNSISIRTSEKSSVMTFTCTTPDPQLSYDVCVAINNVAPTVIEEKFFGKLKPLDAPKLPKTYSSPNVMKNTVLGAFLGAFFAIAVLTVIKLLNNKIMSERDIGTSYLGTIPAFENIKSVKGKVTDDEEKLSAQNNFFIVESYKHIRTNLMYTFSNAKNGNIVAFSGAEVAAGKSITCANLSIAFAQNGFRVLVIDADMRRPKQQKLFKRTHTEGLSKLLSEQCTFEEAIIRNAAPNLDLIPAGPIPPNPSELISSAAMDELLEKASIQYDYVFIDTPPINLLSDCLAMANKINGVVLVARQRHTEKDEFAKTILNLKNINAKIIGTVLTDVLTESKKYYNSAYYKSSAYYKTLNRS